MSVTVSNPYTALHSTSAATSLIAAGAPRSARAPAAISARTRGCAAPASGAAGRDRDDRGGGAQERQRVQEDRDGGGGHQQHNRAERGAGDDCGLADSGAEGLRAGKL